MGFFLAAGIVLEKKWLSPGSRELRPSMWGTLKLAGASSSYLDAEASP